MTSLAVMDEQGLLYIATATVRALVLAVALLLPIGVCAHLLRKAYLHLWHQGPAPNPSKYALVFLLICVPTAWLAHALLNADGAYRESGQQRQPSSAEPPPETDAEWREYEQQSVDDVNRELQRAGDERRDQLINEP